MKPWRFLLLLGVLAIAAETNAQKTKQSFLDAESAGPDFLVQGEYVGKIGTETVLGAQVIALGSGKFDAVLYAGGLPGAGWDKKTKVHLTGETANGLTRFAGKNFEGRVADGKFTGTAEDGVPFELEHIVRRSPTLETRAPDGATILFDGSNVDAWAVGPLEDGNLLGVAARTKQKFKDFTLHLEFRTPFMPFARGQARGNSGMYLLDQYECQVLDSFGLTGENNECGGIYQIAKPTVNMCYPPLSWQTYDVEFKAARYDDAGNKTADAVTTIRHNGVVIHDQLSLPKITPGGGQSDERPGALYLQNHGDPVRYRNIWIVEN